MKYSTRKRLALVVLVVGLPLYIAVAAVVLSLFERPNIWVELAIYVALGIAWVLPFRALFRGTARPDPEDGDDA
ncbi:MAG: DUF2842 domain-containing protein [Paracoccaceae bacterium]